MELKEALKFISPHLNYLLIKDLALNFRVLSPTNSQFLFERFLHVILGYVRLLQKTVQGKAATLYYH